MKPTSSEESLVARMLALPPEERTAFFQHACAEDPGLDGRMREIMEAIGSSSGPTGKTAALVSDDTAVRALGFALESRGDEISGVSIGNYKLLQKIGEGGFGVVWMAEQEQPIRRRVAVKIIKIGMDTEEVIARFEAERQALALMEHPNIARVFDAGATDAGRPYFVMELVRGVAITRYCDENRVPPEARLRLFVTVCQAVQHAHQKGVIHRDLKPSNILVTLHDGVPVPKIIDFGIAKATSARLTEKTLFTQFHAFIGTPAYTSPEQMEMSGLDIDTRSDIYSLGVLLYELLTGHPPFDSDTLVKSGLEAMRRTIREIDPPRPSHRLNTLTEVNRTSIAHQRATDAGKLSLLLRGDLDWIAMRCLEKDRTRRYDSATSLAADIERHLTDGLVEARPPSRIYRAKKFVRRHRLAVGAATAVAVSLVAGLMTSSVLLVSERITRRRAEAAERHETELRQQADSARDREAKRVSHNSVILANHLLDDGKTAEALAYFVHGARKDPGNGIVAPRLASILATRNFLIPQAAPYHCGSQIIALHFTRDGLSFFVGTEDGTLRVFDAGSGELKREIKLGRPVMLNGWAFARNDDSACAIRFVNNTLGVLLIEAGQLRGAPTLLDPEVWASSESLGLGAAVGLSPDGHWLFARSPNNIWVWNTATGEKRLEIPLSGTLNGTDISSDGRQLALSARTDVQLWPLSDGAPARVTIPFPPNPQGRTIGTTVRYSPDGRRLVLCHGFLGLMVFDAVTGEKLRSLPPWDDYLIPQTLEFANSGWLFAAGNRSSGLWNVESGEFRKLPVGSGETLAETGFDAAGKQLLTISKDGFTRLWDSGTGMMVAEPTLQQNARLRAAQSPDGRRLAIGTAAGGVHLFSVGQGRARPLIVPRSPTPSLFVKDAPTRLLWMGADRARVLDAATGHWVGNGFRYPEPVLTNSANDFSPPIRADLKFMVVRDRQQQWHAWEIGPDRVTHVARLEGAPTGDGLVLFNPRADVVAIIAQQMGQVGLWDLHTGARTAPSFNHDAGLVYLSATFSPDGRRLGVGAIDGGGILLDTDTMRPWGTLETRPLTPVYEVRFSADGSRVVTTNTGHEMQLWDASTRQPIGPVRLSLDALRARFSPDGRWIATWGAQAVNLWDGHTGEPIGDTIPVSGKHVRFSSDGERVTTIGDDGNAQVWDIHSGLPITERMAHGPTRMLLAEFSPDGRFLRTEGILMAAPNVLAFGVWSVPPPLPKGAATPEWLLQLATMFANKSVDEAEQCVDDSAAVEKIVDLRRQIAALPADSPLAEWGRWILNDRADRSIAPGFTLTPAEAEKFTAELAAAVNQASP